jgi:beta-barrel assembly-enhancing protease
MYDFHPWILSCRIFRFPNSFFKFLSAVRFALKEEELMSPLYALTLALLIPPLPDHELPLFTPEDLLHQPFVVVMELQNPEGFSPSELKALRSRVEEERDRKIAELRQREDDWKKKIVSDRHELEALNKRASRDNAAEAKQRAELHTEIAALERCIRDASIERERTIPAAYERKLAKVWLAEHWPARRDEVLQQIEEGQARDRRHGDAEDIGYRRLVKNPEQDVPAGEQAARQMIAGGWLPFELQDNEVQAYVRTVAARIAANSDLKVPLRVTVLDSAELKALALPGGYLYVTTGVIRAAQTESELAGVLSREVARIAARHGTRSSKMAVVSKLFVPVTQIATGIFTGGAVSPAAAYGIGYGIEGLGGVLQHSLNGMNEKFQREADQLGIQYAWKAGYDPRGFISFLDSASETTDSNFLTEEPSLQERLLNSFAEIQFLPPQKDPAPDTGEFDRIRKRVVR